LCLLLRTLLLRLLSALWLLLFLLGLLGARLLLRLPAFPLATLLFALRVMLSVHRKHRSEKQEDGAYTRYSDEFHGFRLLPID
jgi:hypothetical protein